MRLDKARMALHTNRSIIGHTLYKFRLMKAHPSNYTLQDRDAARSKLKVAQILCKHLLERHPEIRPIKVRQLHLFKAVRVHRVTKTATPAAPAGMAITFA